MKKWVGGRGKKVKWLLLNVLEEGGLYDLGSKGDKFTWSNKHEDETFTKERLDRTVVNAKWKSLFQEG